MLLIVTGQHLQQSIGIADIKYKVNVTHDEEILTEETLVITNFTQHTLKVTTFGLYNISVVAVVQEELESSHKATLIDVPTGIII